MATNQQILDKLEEISSIGGCQGKDCAQYKESKIKRNIFTLFIAILIFVSSSSYGRLEAFKKETKDGIVKDFQDHIVDFTKLDQNVQQNTKDMETCKRVEELVIRLDTIIKNMEAEKRSESQ